MLDTNSLHEHEENAALIKTMLGVAVRYNLTSQLKHYVKYKYATSVHALSYTLVQWRSLQYFQFYKKQNKSCLVLHQFNSNVHVYSHKYLFLPATLSAKFTTRFGLGCSFDTTT